MGGQFRQGRVYTSIALTVVLLHTGALLQPWVPYELLTRDIFLVAGAPPYFGVLSNLGVALWLIGAAVAVFAAWVLRGHTPAAGPLLWAGLLTVWLCLDDFLMIHEIAGQRLRISSSVVVGFEGAAALTWLARHRRWIGQSEWRWIAWAAGAWGVSLLADFSRDELGGVMSALPTAWAYFAEDMPKLVGVAIWTCYLWIESERALRENGTRS